MEWRLHEGFEVLHCGLFLADAQFVDNFGDSLPIMFDCTCFLLTFLYSSVTDSGMEYDIELSEHFIALRKAVEDSRKLLKEAPNPSKLELVKMASANACIFQQAAMQMLVDARISDGAKKFNRLEMACRLADVATKALTLALKHSDKEKVILPAVVSSEIGSSLESGLESGNFSEGSEF